MEEKKNGPPWVELVNILPGVLALVGARMKYQNLLRISYLFTPEELLREQDGYILLCLFALGMMIRPLWMLLTWKAPRNLMGGIANVFGAVCWTLALLACRSAYWDGEMKAVWACVLILYLGLGCWDLWKYRKQKLLEEIL